MKHGLNVVLLLLACLAVDCNAFWKWQCRSKGQGDLGTCGHPFYSYCEGSYHNSRHCLFGFKCCVPKPPPRQQVCNNYYGERGVCKDYTRESCENGYFARGFCRGRRNLCCIEKYETAPPAAYTKSPTPEPTPEPTLHPTETHATPWPTPHPSETPAYVPSQAPTSAPVVSRGNVLRKEVSDMTPTERAELVSAINKLREEGTWDEFADVHSTFFSRGIHNGPQFWPWHRVFLLVLEEELSRVAGKPMAFPYWDWTRNARNPEGAAVFQDNFFGGFAPNSVFSGCIESGPFVNWQPCIRRNSRYRGNTWDQVDVQRAFNQGNGVYENVRRNIENLHNAIHNNVGGDMATTNSPIDPVFWAHHCYIDKLWSDWQGLSPENERAYAAGLEKGQILFYTQYTVEDTFNKRPFEGVETRRRLVESLHNNLNKEGIDRNRVLYAESSRSLSSPSFSQMSKLSPQQLSKIPRTCAAPEPDSELIVFWNDEMTPFFEASAARVEAGAGETDDCINHDTLNVILAGGGSDESSGLTTAGVAGVIVGLVAFSVIATVGGVVAYRRRLAAVTASKEDQIVAVELPEL